MARNSIYLCKKKQRTKLENTLVIVYNLPLLVHLEIRIVTFHDHLVENDRISIPGELWKSF